MRSEVAVLVLVAATVLGTGTARATTAADVCPGDADPCELTRTVTVSTGSTLDFGARTFVIRAPNGRLQVGGGDTLAITAGSMIVETGANARLRSAPGSAGGCAVDVETSGEFAVRRVPGPVLAIDFSSSAAACQLTVTAGGDVTINGEIQARGTGPDADGGGSIILSAGGAVTIGERILADGSVFGGSLEVSARGPIVLAPSGSVDVSDAFGFGNVALIGESDVSIGGRIDVKGTAFEGFCGDGGFVDVFAGGDVTIDGTILATGAPIPLEGCSGGTLGMQAAKSIFVNGTLDFSSGPDGQGGFLEEITALEDFVSTGSISVHGNGTFGVGGDVLVFAGRRAHLGGTVDLNGGAQGGGGNVRVQAGERLELAGNVGADGADAFGSMVFTTASDADPLLGGRIVVTGDVHATSRAEAFAMDVRLEACQIEVAAGGRVRTTGTASRNLLRASDTMAIAGTLDAGTGTNRLEHRDAAKPPQIASGATVVPPPMITATPDEPLLPCPCTLDPSFPGILCADDGNPCTQEVCQMDVGCARVPLMGEGIAGCDDGDVCDGREACVDLACTPGTPPPADDGDPCTDDGACDPVAGYTRRPKTGLDAAVCRMERIEAALASAAPGDILRKASRKIGKLARSVTSLVGNARTAGGKRQARLLEKATKKTARLARLVASPRSGIRPNLAQVLQLATTEAQAVLATRVR